jgi:hypothetical protein
MGINSSAADDGAAETNRMKPAITKHSNCRAEWKRPDVIFLHPQYRPNPAEPFVAKMPKPPMRRETGLTRE